jgi:hypothetical protein
MTFLNAILALGTLAFTVPLIIHLLYRSKYRVVEWGAMHLLDLNLQVNSRSFEWKNLLLLLLRCLIPIFLALAMARPLIQSWLSSGSGEPISLAIILDDSPSMQAKRSDGQTRWAKALSAIQSVIRSVPAGSQVAIILGGKTPLLISENDVPKYLTSWESKPSVSGKLSIDEATSMALDWLSESASSRHQLLYLSDFQANDWTGSAFPMQSLESQLKKQVVAPKLDWINMGGQDANEKPINLAVEEISVAPQWISENQDVAIVVTVRNHSSTDQENVKLRIDVDWNEIDQQSFRIPAKSSLQVRTRWNTKGSESPSQQSHLIRAFLSGDDSLLVDNEAWKTIFVHAPFAVLLVDGDPKSGPMESETDFLRVALSPFSLTNQGRSDFFRCQVTPPHSWNEETLKGVRVVALCNSVAISEQQQVVLRKFVENGGGLVVFPGDRVKHDDWNRWKSIGEGGVRTTKFQPRVEVKDPSSEETKRSIDPDSFRATVLTELSRAAKESLRESQIKGFHPMEPESDTAEVIGRTSEGQPWLIRSRLGKGVILVLSTSCDDRDTNLPSRPVFVPLMQRLFHLAASTESPAGEFETGEPWTVAPPITWNTEEKENAKLVIRGPDQVERESATRTVTSTRQAGLYEAIWSSNDKTNRTPAVFQSSRLAKGDDSDSALRPADNGDLQQIAATWQATMHEDAAGLIDSARSQWQGREIGSWFWILAIVCFLAEMVVEQSFLVGSRRAVRTNSPVATFGQGGR